MFAMSDFFHNFKVPNKLNMKTIQNLIFDFDGTLADTAPLIMATMQTTIHELQLRRAPTPNVAPP